MPRRQQPQSYDDFIEDDLTDEELVFLEPDDSDFADEEEDIEDDEVPVEVLGDDEEEDEDDPYDVEDLDEDLTDEELAELFDDEEDEW